MIQDSRTCEAQNAIDGNVCLVSENRPVYLHTAGCSLEVPFKLMYSTCANAKLVQKF